MRGYAAMHATRPDFFIHSGDTIYADGPIAAQVTEPDGRVWRNLVTEEVSKVAETLNDTAAGTATTSWTPTSAPSMPRCPVIAQWDDHETHNNWYPGEIITDARYTERRVDVLAARGRQAWQEYQPIAAAQRRQHGLRTRPHLPQDLPRPAAGHLLPGHAHLQGPQHRRQGTAPHPHPRPGAGRLADPGSQQVQSHLEGHRRGPPARHDRAGRSGEPGIAVQPRRRRAPWARNSRSPGCWPPSNATGSKTWSG